MSAAVVTTATEKGMVEGFANWGGACLWASCAPCGSAAVIDGTLGTWVCKTQG